MPDWFYQPVSRPLLFRLSAPAGRDFALGFMGRLARLPFGSRLIDFLGHMRPDARLERSVLGITFPTALGLGPGLDRLAVALPALAQFGFGFLDLGPISVEPVDGAQRIERRTAEEAVWWPEPRASAGLSALVPKIVGAARLGLPLVARLSHAPQATAAQATAAKATGEGEQLVAQLAPYVHVFALGSMPLAMVECWTHDAWAAHASAIVDQARRQPQPRPVLVCVPADLDLVAGRALIELARAAGVQGVLIDGSVAAAPYGVVAGRPARQPAIDLVSNLRHEFGKSLALIASGGVHEPVDALALYEAGADLVELDTGLVFSGPGLSKRINDAVLYRIVRDEREPAAVPAERPAEMSWMWTLLMGAGMLIGSLLALGIAATRQLLPYDESFVCMPRAMLTSINGNLLAFMAHDRVTLAGAMVAIGLLYVSLSWFGVRRGAHWARTTIFVSAFTGFASFFSFLGFGYLDPLHAFVTSVLLQFLLLAVHSRPSRYQPSGQPYLRNERGWQLGQWGQLLLVLHGCLLLLAGIMISAIGMTSVFVPEDLRFMGTTAEVLEAANPRLIPLVAHDRATLGGMLLASGWAFLLPALWGFGTPARWLWWTLLGAGGAAYAAAIGVHLTVGYLDRNHLLPAFAGLGLFGLGLVLAYPLLVGCRSTQD